jgi:hypothetical protein
VLSLSAVAGVSPITAGGAVANAGATAGILLALGVGKDIAINFSLASGLLLVTSASAAALSGLAFSVGRMRWPDASRRPAGRSAETDVGRSAVSGPDEALRWLCYFFALLACRFSFSVF